MEVLVTGGAGYIGSHTVEDMCRSAWRFARQNGK